jgi:hypothetical protein
VVKTELMRAADAAARAAAAQLPMDATSAKKAALDVAVLNTADGTDVSLTSGDITLGTWDAKNKKFVPLATGASYADAVQVTAKRTVGSGNSAPMLLSVFGPKSCDVSATVVAKSETAAIYGIIGLNWVNAPGTATIDSFQSDDGPYSSCTRRYNGSVASNGNISLSGSSQILGNASPGMGGGYSVTGGYVSGSREPITAPLVYPPPSAGNASTSNQNSSVAKYLSADRSFTISGQNQVDFRKGVYYFKNFSATGGAVINANVDGPVTIYITGNFTLTGGTSAYNGDAQSLKIVLLNASTSAVLTGNSDLYADLYAPLSDITITGTADYYGQMVGKTVTLSGSGQIHYDENLNSPKRKIVTVK